MGRPPKRDPQHRPEWSRRLTDVRGGAGWTQETLAAEVNISQSMIGAYETGESEPNFAQVERIAKACNVRPCWLIFGEGDPNEGDPMWGPLFRRYKNHPQFAFTFATAARMLTEEGMKADFAYLIGYVVKLLAAAEADQGGDGIEQSIRNALDIQRAELRAKLDDLRKNLL